MRSDSGSGSRSGKTLARLLVMPVALLGFRLAYGLACRDCACATGVPSRLVSRTSLCFPADSRSGRQVAWERLLRRLLAARWTRTVELESARARPVALVLPERVGESSVGALWVWSRVENVGARDERFVRRLLFRKMLELTERMDARLSSMAGVGCGDAGGVETGVWTLLRREEGAWSSYLK